MREAADEAAWQGLRVPRATTALSRPQFPHLHILCRHGREGVPRWKAVLGMLFPVFPLTCLRANSSSPNSPVPSLWLGQSPVADLVPSLPLREQRPHRPACSRCAERTNRCCVEDSDMWACLPHQPDRSVLPMHRLQLEPRAGAASPGSAVPDPAPACLLTAGLGSVLLLTHLGSPGPTPR